MSKFEEIIGKYTKGEATLPETNEALQEAGAGYHLDPTKDMFTPQEILDAKGGDTPDGAGIYDDGTKVCKMYCHAGKLAQKAFALPEGWDPAGYYPGNHYFYIAGEKYIVDKDGETLLPYTGQDFSAPASDVKKELDQTRHPEYANRDDVEQVTAHGTYISSYGPNGEYLGSRRK